MHTAGRYGQSLFLDDAILIEKYENEFRGTHYMRGLDFSTRGSVRWGPPKKGIHRFSQVPRLVLRQKRAAS